MCLGLSSPEILAVIPFSATFMKTRALALHYTIRSVVV